MPSENWGFDVLNENHWIEFEVWLVGLLVTLGLGWYLARKGQPSEWLGRFLLPASIWIVGTTVVIRIHSIPFVDWNAARLAPAFALARGLQVYSTPDSGFVLNTIYPPLSMVAYLPATLFLNPTVAILAGSTLSLVYFLAPIAWLCMGRGRGYTSTGYRLFASFVFLGFVLLAVTRPPLAVGSAIHADSPAIGFAAFACIILISHREKPGSSTLRMIISTLFATLAVATKQTLFPILIVLPLWFGIQHGVRRAIHLSLLLFFWLSMAGLLCIGIFGKAELFFNILDIPRKHPWIYGKFSSFQTFFLLFGELVDHGLPVLATLFIAAKLCPLSSPRSEHSQNSWLSSFRSWIRDHPWSLLALTSLFMIPTSLLGRIKVGGSVNNLAAPIYFLTAALVMLVIDWYRTDSKPIDYSRQKLLIPIFLVSMFSPFALAGAIIKDLNGMRVLSENPQEVAYRYARAHPGQAYFPWNPLSTFLAEQRIDHFEYGLFDRDLAGFPISTRHFLQHISPKTRLVAFPPDRATEWTLKYLPAFNKRVEIPELPGWICYEQ